MAKCPMCEAEAVQKYRPFCSKRCADIDLGKWMTGGYALPSEEPVDPDELEREIERETRRSEND
ncbi:MAG: DNA gyrase inhibitor YacG [Pseudomonadota bacterium]